ncbi:winged helix-turn-helix domain-containing protein [Candidatus Woesearchaeota archaeon]|nr:winged helix-turn-helix domain-containing protein [Candidatus Woesearchaeota archaeon]
MDITLTDEKKEKGTIGTITIAPLGMGYANIEPGLKRFPSEQLFAIVCSKDNNKQKYIDEISKLIKVITIEVDGDVWEETFKAASNIVSGYKNKEIVVNVSAADANSGCAATCAAFVNGIKAFRVMNNEIKMLPVIKFSYYKLIPDKKMDILRYLSDNEDCCASMDELSKRLKMSLPLISYHINGTLRAEGLKNMGLITTDEVSGRIRIKLTSLARLILSGHIVAETED